MIADSRRRASPGYTYELCHGCGKEEYRRKGTLCSECRTLLDTAIRTKEDQEKRGELVQIKAPSRPGDMPYIDEFDSGLMSHDDQYQFTKALHAVVMATSEKVAAGDRWSADGEHLFEYGSYAAQRRSFESRAMPAAVANAVRRLFVEAKAMTQRAYTKGAADGRSLLLGLASGRITNDQFNDAATRQEGGK